MGFKCNFLDNEIYGADDVSEAFSRIMSSGVMAYQDNGTVAEALNEMTGELINSGVTNYSGMQISVSDNEIYIAPGTAFFNSGVSVVVDENGEMLERADLTEGYVYFLYEPELNLVAPKFSDSLPDKDIVPLAFISADGKVTDIRRYAMSKVALNSKNNYFEYQVSLDWFGEAGSTDDKNKIVIDLPHNGFRYLMIKKAECPELKNRFFAEQQVFDFEEGDYFETYTADTQISTYLTIEKTGTQIVMRSIRYNQRMPHSFQFVFA